MTVKELKEIMDSLNPETEVYYTNYGGSRVNGWYTDIKNEAPALVLTDLYVEPRKA